MLRVTVDLVPFGEESESRPIGEMIIGNVEMLPGNRANYVYFYKNNHGVSENGMVYNFDRGRDVWDLVKECLYVDNNPMSQDMEDYLSLRFKHIT